MTSRQSCTCSSIISSQSTGILTLSLQVWLAINVIKFLFCHANYSETTAPKTWFCISNLKIRHLANLWPIITSNEWPRLICRQILPEQPQVVLSMYWNTSEYTKRYITKGFFHGFPKRTEDKIVELSRISASGKMKNKILTLQPEKSAVWIIKVYVHFKLSTNRLCLLPKEGGSRAVPLAKGLGNSVVLWKPVICPWVLGFCHF